MKIIAGLSLTSIFTIMVIFAFTAQEVLGNSSLRPKRDANEIKNKVSESLGVGEVCGGGIGNLVGKDQGQCNAITDCQCEETGVLSTKKCTCQLTWWFILILVVLVLFILGMVACCVLKALGKALCCKC